MTAGLGRVEPLVRRMSRVNALSGGPAEPIDQAVEGWRPIGGGHDRMVGWHSRLNQVELAIALEDIA